MIQPKNCKKKIFAVQTRIVLHKNGNVLRRFRCFKILQLTKHVMNWGSIRYKMEMYCFFFSNLVQNNRSSRKNEKNATHHGGMGHTLRSNSIFRIAMVAKLESNVWINAQCFGQFGHGNPGTIPLTRTQRFWTAKINHKWIGPIHSHVDLCSSKIKKDARCFGLVQIT